ncbi:hypothetical protein M0802_006906 [Mischocyttarus mexicanus]|nr:hypothetical protein M0802_006906 [Mischocyttarus mexicanus]
MRRVKLNNSGIPGVFNCRFSNAAVVNPNRKKKKPTTFVPPPPPQDQSTSTVSPTTAGEDTKQWLNGNNGHQQIIPFWKKAASFSNVLQTGSSLSVNLIREKLRQKKQQQLRELKAIQEEIKEGKLFPPLSASPSTFSSSPSVLNQQPPPSKKLHTSPNTILFTSPSLVPDGDEGVALTSWPPVKMHCLLPPPPVSPYHSNSHSSSLWKVSQRDKTNVPEILLAPRCLPIHCAHWTPPGHLNHSRNGKGESSKDESEEGEISDMEGSQVSLPRSYTLPREFKYYHSTNMLRDKERCGGPSKVQPSRFYLPSTYSSDGDVDSADNEEETDSELQVVIKEGHNCSSDRTQQRKYAQKDNDGTDLSSNNCDASTEIAISNNSHHNNLYGILRPNQLFKARLKKILIFITTEKMELDEEDDQFLNENTNIQNWHSIKEQQNVLVNACKQGQLNLIEEHLKDNDVNSELHTGWTLLLHAASFCNVEVVRYLLEHGADANKHKDGFTPLMALCSSTTGSTSERSICLSLLIEASDSVDAVDNYKQTALMFACRTCDVENVKLLLKYVTDIDAQDSDGYTALMYAVLKNNIEITKLLLNNKADPFIKNNYYDNAKDIAELKEYEEISLLFKESDYFTVTYTTTTISKWEHLFSKLNPTKDHVININILNALNSIELHYYINHFQGMEFETFLKLTEEDLINLKMNISVHRNRLLKYLNYFHFSSWDQYVLKEMIKNNKESREIIEMMALITQQILIMTSSFHFIQKYVNNDSVDDIFAEDIQIYEYTDKIESIKETVATLKKRLLRMKTVADELNVKNSLKMPPNYIGPKVVKKNYFKPIILSMLLVYGICLMRVKIFK